MRWLPHEPLTDRERAVALGVFDGIHIGHRAVISAVCGIRQSDTATAFLTACVLSLTDVPKSGEHLPADTDQLCATLGVEEWLSLPFEAVREMSPEQFVREILHERLHARLVCCGYNYHFGKGGVGTADTLIRLCNDYGIKVRVIPSVEADGAPVSSTRIRALLKNGDMPAVMRLLGRPFTICRPVSRGNGRGHTWGFPTINQVFEDGVCLPRFGVYASLVTVEGKQHFAVTNVGTHPTVGNTLQAQAETYIDGFDGDLYGQTITVELIRHLRDEERFDSVERLKAQIEHDKNEAITLLSGQAHTTRAVLFDFDDTLQDRSIAFCGAVRDMLRRHFPALSDKERESRVRVMLEQNNGGYVEYVGYFETILRLWNWEDEVSPQSLKEEFFHGYFRHTSLFEQSVRLLTVLREKGYAVGIITNGPRMLQNSKLDVSGLRPLCDITVVSGDEGVHKPDPELFRRAAARLCVAPTDCVYVGDHPVNDIEGALSAGMKAIFMNGFWTNDLTADVPIIRAPEELLTLL